MQPEGWALRVAGSAVVQALVHAPCCARPIDGWVARRWPAADLRLVRRLARSALYDAVAFMAGLWLLAAYDDVWDAVALAAGWRVGLFYTWLFSSRCALASGAGCKLQWRS